MQKYLNSRLSLNLTGKEKLNESGFKFDIELLESIRQ